MSLLIVVIVAVSALAALAVAALGATFRRGHDHDAEAQTLADLSELRSPSGKSFFPDGDSVLELAEALEDAGVARRSSRA